MKFSKMLVGLLVFVAMTTNGPAQAQSVQSLDLPPQQSMKDQNDVNWLNAMYEPESRELSIGVEGADLTFVRHNSSGGWGSNMLNSVTYGAYTVTLLLGYSSKVFDRPGTAGNPANDGILRPKDHDGSILTETGSGFTYTARDGSVFSFTKTYQSYSFFGRNAIVATQITRPNGEITSFTYKTYAFPVAGSPSVNELRLQSVNNNRGQQYKFSYAAPNSGVLTSVSAINNAVDYCAPSADACSGFSQSWPTVSFSLSPNAQGGETLLKTDPVGNVWTYAYGTNVDGDLSTETFRRPTEAQDNISVAYKTVAAIDRGDFTHIASPYLLKPFKVKSVTRPGQFWNYAFGKPFGYLWQGTITDPLANVDVFQAQGVVTGTSRIFKDPLNRVTRYELDYYDRYYSATNPELNLATATLDLRGNTTALRRTAKPSTGLADIVSSLALAATCTNYATCNKPNSFTDPLGNRTDYTYDPVHGGLLTETLPPAPNGVRPQKRYSYGQVYAWVKNASGVLVQASSPIWLVTQISECRTTASCVGTADETRTTFGYGAAGTVNAQRVMSKTVASGDGTLSTTTAYTYDCGYDALAL
ncbi:MAG: hypothetical protein IPF97_12830 [Sphingomonadales bacterium]|nr:hypothetical protein [Sphingomonadales bacterium]